MSSSLLALAAVFVVSNALDAPCRMWVNTGNPLPLDICLANSYDGSSAYTSRMYKCESTNVVTMDYATADCSGDGVASQTASCVSTQGDFDEFCFCGSAYSLCSAYENRIRYGECANNLYGAYALFDTHIHSDCYPFPTNSAQAPFAKSQSRNCTTTVTYADTDCQTVETVETNSIADSQCVRYTAGCANPPTPNPTTQPTASSSSVARVGLFFASIIAFILFLWM